MEEDNMIQVSFFAFDYDGFLNGTPSIEVTAQPENGSLSQLSGPNISGLIAEWIATYTPNENYFGNDMITFLVPAFIWSAALVASVNTPVDSTTISAPKSPQGMLEGSRSAVIAIS